MICDGRGGTANAEVGSARRIHIRSIRSMGATTTTTTTTTTMTWEELRKDARRCESACERELGELSAMGAYARDKRRK
jgi:hypothetical protein